MLDYRSLASNAAVAFLAQGVSFLLSVVTSLIVPKVLGVEAFGYWQLFIFYVGYTGFFHLGLSDGVYLQCGGEHRGRIDLRGMLSRFLCGLSYELVFAAGMVVFALAAPMEQSRRFVVLATAAYMLLTNVTRFFSLLFQAMNETKRASYATIMQRFAFLVPLVACLVFREHDFRWYVAAYVLACGCGAIYCLAYARDFLRARPLPWGRSWRLTAASIGIGWKLMIANVAGTLILGIARAGIDGRWGIVEFGRVSFALSLVTFFLAFVNQAAAVLFPALRRVDADECRRFFARSTEAMGLLFPVVYVLYAPMSMLVELWLPQYADTLVYFAILLPMCVFESRMNIAGATFFKVLRMEGVLLALNLGTVALSGACTALGVLAFHSIEFVLFGAVCAIMLRGITAELLVARRFGMRMNALAFEELALTATFLVSAVTLGHGWRMFALSGCAWLVYMAINHVRVRGLAHSAIRLARAS